MSKPRRPLIPSIFRVFVIRPFVIQYIVFIIQFLSTALVYKAPLDRRCRSKVHHCVPRFPGGTGGMDWLRRHERVINWTGLLGWRLASSIWCLTPPEQWGARFDKRLYVSA